VRLIVSRIAEDEGREENAKEDRKEKETGRRKKDFRVKLGKKIQGKKTEFQASGFPPLSFRR